MTSDEPKLPSNYDELIAPFYQSLGRAFTRWQHVESAMFALARMVIGGTFDTASIIFFHVKSQDSKLQLTNKLCLSHIKDEARLAEWKGLNVRIREAINARNLMAHFEVNYVTNRDYLAPGEPPFALSSHHMDVNQSQKSATAETLNAIAKTFMELSKDLFAFVRRNFDIEAIRASGLDSRLIGYLERL